MAALALVDIDRVQNGLAKLVQMDLSFVSQRLMRENGWNEETLRSARRDFDYFSAVAKAFPEAEIIPTKLGDEFWHAFLLFTHEYESWCSKFFGGFVHHEPGRTPLPAMTFSREAYWDAFGYKADELGASCCSGGRGVEIAA